MPAALGGVQMRPYQREGLAWLAFLRRSGLHGVLADDMVPPRPQLPCSLQATQGVGRMLGPCGLGTKVGGEGRGGGGGRNTDPSARVFPFVLCPVYCLSGNRCMWPL